MVSFTLVSGSGLLGTLTRWSAKRAAAAAAAAAEGRAGVDQRIGRDYGGGARAPAPSANAGHANIGDAMDPSSRLVYAAPVFVPPDDVRVDGGEEAG